MNTENKIPAPKVTYRHKGSLKKPQHKWLKVSSAVAAAVVLVGLVVGSLVYYENNVSRIETAQIPITNNDTQENATSNSAKITANDTTNKKDNNFVNIAPEKNKVNKTTTGDNEASGNKAFESNIAKPEIQKYASLKVKTSGRTDNKILEDTKEAAQDDIQENNSENQGFVNRKVVSTIIRNQEIAMAYIPTKTAITSLGVTQNDFVLNEDYDGITIKGIIDYFSNPQPLKIKPPTVIEDIKEGFKDSKSRLPETLASITSPFRKK